MLSKLTHKQFFYVYLTALLLALLVVYSIAVKPTFIAKKAAKNETRIYEQGQLAPERIAAVTKKLNEINAVLGTTNINRAVARENIVNTISRYCDKNRLVVTSLPERHLFSNKNFQIETNQIIVQGSFKKLLKLVAYLEQKPDFEEIVSIRFYSVENRRTDKTELFVQLTLQNILEYDKVSKK